MQLGQQMDPSQLPEELYQKLDGLVKKDKIVLFMKGDRQFPQCGFSDAVVKTLNASQAEYVTYDILANPDIRSGMKVYSSWPTFPQLYINSEFVGGCDIVVEMFQNGELEKLLN